jgi:hypothetical protein
MAIWESDGLWHGHLRPLALCELICLEHLGRLSSVLLDAAATGYHHITEPSTIDRARRLVQKEQRQINDTRHR